MELAEIQKHWATWAKAHETDYRATTKARTAKVLEVDALRRRVGAILGNAEGARVLEVGCGNGINCIELAKSFPTLRAEGVDYVSTMIEAAKENGERAEVSDRVSFMVGDVLKLDEHTGVEGEFDIVFTTRCLINLNTAELQGQAIAALERRVKPGGHLLMIENSLDTFAAQNAAREALDLEARTPSEFNRFFTDAEMLGHVRAAGLEFVEIEDFGGLHDLVLYALAPAANDGKIDYEDPLVEAATKVTLALAGRGMADFGPYGQNRLYVTRRPAEPRTEAPS